MDSIFKNKRKEYIKLIGLKLTKEIDKEIKNIPKSFTLEEFKLCVTPMIDEKKIKEIGEKTTESFSSYIGDALVPLKAEQIKEIRKGIEEGLTAEKIEIYKKSNLNSKDMALVRSILVEYEKIINKETTEQNLFLYHQSINNINEITSKYNGENLKKSIHFNDLCYKKELEKKYKKLNYNYNIEDKEMFELYQKLPQNFKEIILFENTVKEMLDKQYNKEKDSDLDGISDIDEITKYGTNYLLKDTDGDLINDKEEIEKLSDPKKKEIKKEKIELER